MDREELIKDIHFYDTEIMKHEHHLDLLSKDSKYREYEEGLVETWKLELKKMKRKLARYPQETKD